MPAIYEISITGFGPSNEAIVNTFHFQAAAELTIDDATGSLTAFCTAAKDPFQNTLTSDWTGYQAKITCVLPANTLSVVQDISDWVGGKTPPSLPLQVAAVIQRMANEGGRKGRGRLFMSPVQASDFDVNGKFVGTMSDYDDIVGLAQENLTPVESPALTAVLFNKAAGVGRPILASKLAVLAGSRRSRRLRSPN